MSSYFLTSGRSKTYISESVHCCTPHRSVSERRTAGWPEVSLHPNLPTRRRISGVFLGPSRNPKSMLRYLLLVRHSTQLTAVFRQNAVVPTRTKCCSSAASQKPNSAETLSPFPLLYRRDRPLLHFPTLYLVLRLPLPGRAGTAGEPSERQTSLTAHPLPHLHALGR